MKRQSLQHKLSTLISLGGILGCYSSIYGYSQKFSQDFIDAIKQENITVSPNNKKTDIYIIGSHLITAGVIIYAIYNIHSIYQNASKKTFVKSYILPACVSSYNDTYTIVVGTIGIAIKAFLYKTIAQVLLAITTCSAKDNFDYLFKKNYHQAG